MNVIKKKIAETENFQAYYFLHNRGGKIGLSHAFDIYKRDPLNDRFIDSYNEGLDMRIPTSVAMIKMGLEILTNNLVLFDHGFATEEAATERAIEVINIRQRLINDGRHSTHK